MDEEVVWIPVVGIGENQKSGDFVIVKYGALENSGLSYVVGPLMHVKKALMECSSLEIVKDALRFYRRWPAGTKMESEIGAMDPGLLRTFIRSHKFVDVLQRDPMSIRLRPSHRLGTTWSRVTGYLHEEVLLRFPIAEETFKEALSAAFKNAD